MKDSPLPKLARILDAILTGILILLAWGALAIFTLLVYTSVRPAGTLPEGLQLVAEIPAHLSSIGASTSDGATVLFPVLHARLAVPLDQTPAGVRAVSVFCKLGLLVLCVAIVVQLRCFVRSLREAHPFVADNAARLRRIAWFTVAIGLWTSLSQMLLASQVSDHFLTSEFSFQAGFDWKTIMFGLGIFIIAEVFKIGVAMKEEQDLTI